jgi:hypothetical protein
MEPLTELGQTEFNQKIRYLYFALSDEETFELPDKPVLVDYIQREATRISIFGDQTALKPSLEFLDQIYPTLALFVPSGFDWDLHRGNFMKRADGTIVITDPIAGDT